MSAAARSQSVHGRPPVRRSLVCNQPRVGNFMCLANNAAVLRDNCAIQLREIAIGEYGCNFCKEIIEGNCSPNASATCEYFSLRFWLTWKVHEQLRNETVYFFNCFLVTCTHNIRAYVLILLQIVAFFKCKKNLAAFLNFIFQSTSF